jgi:hypothetical protein
VPVRSYLSLIIMSFDTKSEQLKDVYKENIKTFKAEKLFQKLMLKTYTNECL